MTDWYQDEGRAWALGMEIRTAVLHIEEGLRQFSRLNLQNDFFPASTLLLGTGLEHFMKLVMALLQQRRTGKFPKLMSLKKLGGDSGHSLTELFAALTTEASRGVMPPSGARSSLDELANDPVLLQALVTLTELADADRRYYFLNVVISGHDSDTDPVDAMNDLDGAVNDATKDPARPGFGKLSELVAVGDFATYFRLRRTMVLKSLEMLVHVLAHLYRDVSPVDEPMLRPWVELEWFGVPPRVRSARRRAPQEGASAK